MKKFILILLAVILAGCPAFAQKSFDMRYNEAAEYYTQKKYDQAIATLEAAKKGPGVTKEQKSRADRLLSQCRSAKAKLSDLTLSKEMIQFSGDAQRDSVYVTAGKSWEVSSCPEWCHTTVESDVLFIAVEQNDLKESRKGMIEVTMGKERTAFIQVVQEERFDAMRVIHIRTIPDRAIIYIDQNSGMMSDRFEVREGRHNVRIEKSGYDRKDTVIVVGRDAQSSDLFYSIALDPSFATISVSIEPEEGYAFDAPKKLDISGNQVNLYPNVVYSFNQDKEIRYYELYENDMIPVTPGTHKIKAESDGFRAEPQDITVVRGEVLPLHFTLKAICGTLTLQDAENSQDAKVFIDGKEAGYIPVDRMKIKTGQHVVRVEKPGYHSEKSEYVVDIVEDKDYLLNVSMRPFVTYNLTSVPAYCQVSVDGQHIGTTPIKLELMEGGHSIRVEKDGYYPQTLEFGTDVSKLNQELTVTLDKTYPLTVTTDRDSLLVSITRGRGKNRVEYAGNVRTPASIALPLSKTMYRLKLTKSNLTTAYDGYFWFRTGKRDHINVLTYSEEYFQAIEVNYLLKKPAVYFDNTKLDKGYQRMGDVGIGRLRLVKGLSTSFIKGAFFWETNSNQQVHYPANGAGSKELLPGDDTYANIKFIPALTMLFLNHEFRVGGPVHNMADINLLATYAWYPNLSKIAPFTHMSGHDIFLGGEFSSRMRVFNANIRMGLQSFYGQANICRPRDPSKTTQSTESRFYSEPYTVPFNKAEFVISVGFTLGGTDSRGNSILRIF